MKKLDKYFGHIIVAYAVIVLGWIIYTLATSRDRVLVQDVVTYETGTYEVKDGKIQLRKNDN